MKKVIVQFAFILAVVMVFISGASAATISCNGSQADCQVKVNAAADGDTITIPAGTFTWTAPVTWTDKNISVIGAGKTSTIINLGSSKAFLCRQTQNLRLEYRA